MVAICVVTFMITTRPNPPATIAAAEDLRGTQNASSLSAEIARAQADQAARLAAQSANTAIAAAQAAADAAVAVSADGAGQNASAIEPGIPDETLASPGPLEAQ